jgi:hypothetical protein
MIAGASPATDNVAVAGPSVSAATALACIDRTALPSGELSKAWWSLGTSTRTCR